MNLNDVESKIMKRLDCNKGISWYEIATYVSYSDLPKDINLMEILKHMEEKGLIERTTFQETGMDKWNITQYGKSLIQME